MKPLAPFQIRDLNREIEDRLTKLEPLNELVVVRSYKKGRCYGIGLSDRRTDLILVNFARLLGGLFQPRPAADTVYTVSLYDTSNAATTLTLSSKTGGSSVILFNYSYSGAMARLGSMLGFGNPASPPTPARTDYELASLVSTITPSATTVDETNWRVIVTGSYSWAAGGTVRETGLYGNFSYGNNQWKLFLLYHDAVSDVVVPAGGTLSVTYTTQL